MDRERAGVGSHRPALALLVACVAVFVALSLDVTHHGAVARLDLRIAPWVTQHVTGELHDWAWRLTHLGDSWLLAIVVVAVAVVLVVQGRTLDAVLLVLVAATVALVTTLTKQGFHRSRPPFLDPRHRLHSFSFPSGHSSGAFAIYVLVAVLLTRGKSTRVRVAAVVAALALATLVAATRVVLPAHYLSDVIAGAAVGLGGVAAGLLIAIWAREATIRGER